jgi:hypothetical protein
MDKQGLEGGLMLDWVPKNFWRPLFWSTRSSRRNFLLLKSSYVKKLALKNRILTKKNFFENAQKMKIFSEKSYWRPLRFLKGPTRSIQYRVGHIFGLFAGLVRRGSFPSCPSVNHTFDF